MVDDTGLGPFLQSRRARLSPQDVGLVPFGDRRRVPGLRREEVAQLAGVSPSYYARLEQGQSRRASPAVLEAIARALGLDGDERAHLLDLARAPARLRARPRRVEQLAPATRALLRSLGPVPALVTGAWCDVLGWTPMGHALVAGHADPASPDRPAERPNTARMVFLDPHSRELHAQWRDKAAAVVAHLRLVAGRLPDDRVHQLVGELTARSAEFTDLWRDQRVTACSVATYDLRHPLVGTLTVTQQSLSLGHDPEQSLVVFTAEAGSSSQAALDLLGHLVGGPAPATAGSGSPARERSATAR